MHRHCGAPDDGPHGQKRRYEGRLRSTARSGQRDGVRADRACGLALRSYTSAAVSANFRVYRHDRPHAAGPRRPGTAALVLRAVFAWEGRSGCIPGWRHHRRPDSRRIDIPTRMIVEFPALLGTLCSPGYGVDRPDRLGPFEAGPLPAALRTRRNRDRERPGCSGTALPALMIWITDGGSLLDLSHS